MIFYKNQSTKKTDSTVDNTRDLGSCPAKLIRPTLHKWADDQYSPAGLGPWLVPDLPLP